MYEVHKELNLEIYIRLSSLSWLGHVNRMESTRINKCIFINFLEGIEPRGRPRLRLARKQHEIRSWERISQDRDKWRRAIEDKAHLDCRANWEEPKPIRNISQTRCQSVDGFWGGIGQSCLPWTMTIDILQENCFPAQTWTSDLILHTSLSPFHHSNLLPAPQKNHHHWVRWCSARMLAQRARGPQFKSWSRQNFSLKIFIEKPVGESNLIVTFDPEHFMMIYLSFIIDRNYIIIKS